MRRRKVVQPDINFCEENQHIVDTATGAAEKYVLSSLTSSFRLSHRPHGLSSRISLSSSESSPLSLGDLCSDSLLLDLLPGMAMAKTQRTKFCYSSYVLRSLNLQLIWAAFPFSTWRFYSQILFLYDNFTNKNIHKARFVVHCFDFRQSITFIFFFSFVLQPHDFILAWKRFQLDVKLFGNNTFHQTQETCCRLFPRRSFFFLNEKREKKREYEWDRKRIFSLEIYDDFVNFRHFLN